MPRPTRRSCEAKYGDAGARQATPNANRGDNLTLGSPYQDTVGRRVVEARLGIRPSRHPEGVRAMTTKRIVVISAGLSTPSSTRQLADRLTADAAAILRERGVDVEAQVFELRDLAHDITNHLLWASPRRSSRRRSTPWRPPTASSRSRRSSRRATPGLFKSFIDVVDPQALTDLPVLIGATGGTPRHSLAIDYAIRPLFTYLHAIPVTTGVFAATSDWGDGGDGVRSLPDRIFRGAKEFAELVERTDRSDLDQRPVRARPSDRPPRRGPRGGVGPPGA